MTDAEQKAREIVNGLLDTIERVDGDTMNWEGIIAAALREAEAAAYEQGYAEGGSSTWADFYFAVSEFTGAEQGENDRPIDVIRKVEAAAYERAAQVAATDALHEIAGERSDWAQGYRDARRSIATAIRQLKDKGE